MLKTVLFALVSIFNYSLFALEISIQGAKEEHQSYSTLHIKNEDKFSCEDQKNEFGTTTEITCTILKVPPRKLRDITNTHFRIKTEISKKTFIITIKPLQKMKLYPMIFDLTKEDTVFNSKIKTAKEWIVIGYQENIPFMKESKKSDTSIDFPFTLMADKLPYVGSLDFNGNPVYIKRVGDVKEYIKIKKLYADKEYENCLDMINGVMKEYPGSLFNAELMFYKIRVNAKLERYESVIEASKVYLREFSSDENVPEVLSLVARAYFKAGAISDADYFFDRLFSEHDDSEYAEWGYIYKAEMLESSGASMKAISIYKNLLSKTKSVEIGSEVTFRMIRNFAGASKYKEAAPFVQKLANATPKHFALNLAQSIDIMNGFAERGDYISASTISKSLIDNIDTKDDNYESLLASSGVWLSKTEQKKEALVMLNRYLKSYSDGTYTKEVQTIKDSLFFDLDDSNNSTKMSTYDKLMSEYNKDSIGDRAVYEKAKLLNKNRRFDETLALENRVLTLNKEHFKDTGQIIIDAAIGAMKQSLGKKECNRVLTLSTKYKIQLSNEWDDGVYECAMKGADYTLAKKVANKNLKSKDLELRKLWLYRYMKIDFATGNYSNVLEASKEIVTLTKGDKNSKYKDVYRYIFDTYQRLEDSNKMINAIADIERVYGQDYLDIDRYVALLSAGSVKRDNNLVIRYGEQIMKIQASSKSNAQSPFAEFALYQAYVEKENNKRALEIIKSLDAVKLNKTDRARQKYLLGSIYDKLWKNDDAKKAYTDSIKADPTSAWAKLSRGAKEI
ncbi:flagellar protein [Sulfurimonas sp.]|uniref:tetratricopeptide repeat protein n=1 Tax=Sulfurimonas sp. TaxID=2022749 RepID=UPI0025D8E8FC|nr:flagellar protein [Sulfurimonas sp.]MDD5157384.1 flagellar protein [Sulfurimonas sp.]